MYGFDTQKIITYKTRPPLWFWNPSCDFVGVIKCLGEVRRAAKADKMLSDLDVVPVRIIEGEETVVEICMGIFHNKEEHLRVRSYNEERLLVLSNVILRYEVPSLAPLAGKKVFIGGRGKRYSINDQEYDNFVVLEFEDAIREGLVICG
ncbi:MAG: hypothetical protein KGI33_08885 [Thaumarchaeota archaeon]|nr:hypothetical protein [Nitrososphaerota archaeon]